MATGLFDHFNKKQTREERIAEGGHMLHDLSASENTEALQREIEAEYGVQIELVRERHDGDEEADWRLLAMQSLAAACGDDEPDYDDLVQESNPHYKPNPLYRPWKPAQ